MRKSLCQLVSSEGMVIAVVPGDVSCGLASCYEHGPVSVLLGQLSEGCVGEHDLP